MIFKQSKIKIAFYLLLVLVIAFALSSCGGDGGDKDSALSITFPNHVSSAPYSFGNEYGAGYARNVNVDGHEATSASLLYIEEDDTIPVGVLVYDINKSFVLKIGDSPVTDIVDANDYEYDGSTLTEIPGDISYGNYFTLDSSTGTVQIISTNNFYLLVTVKSADGKTAQLWIAYKNLN